MSQQDRELTIKVISKSDNFNTGKKIRPEYNKDTGLIDVYADWVKDNGNHISVGLGFEIGNYPEGHNVEIQPRAGLRNYNHTSNGSSLFRKNYTNKELVISFHKTAESNFSSKYYKVGYKVGTLHLVKEDIPFAMNIVTDSEQPDQ